LTARAAAARTGRSVAPSKRRRQLLTIESPLPHSHFMLRLLEPRSSCPDKLWDRLRAGSYDKPFVIDKGPRRLLQFDFSAIQSAMLLSSPQRLLLAYTREMMAFLLFNPAPARILLLGLGGGSLAKFCHRHLPAADITAVEVSADVIALRREFSIPADDARFRVIHGDGATYVSALHARIDVILADACDSSGIATQFDSIRFYRNARACLAPGGVLVANVCGEQRTCADHLAKLLVAFDGEVLILKMPTSRNLVAFAFRDQPPAQAQMRVAAESISRRFGIDLPRYARNLSRYTG
jgi:spermidine synthase